MPYKNAELVKWVALFLMVGDHVNKYLLNETIPFLYNAGRIAMPLFCFVLAYNLARPDALRNGNHTRTAQRLFIFAVIATPAYIFLGGVIDDWWPLNILFTLLAITIICYLIDKGEGINKLYALFIFFAAGAVVEFWWPAIAMGVSIWLFYRIEQKRYLICAVFFCASLAFINQNFYALLAIPIIMTVGNYHLELPRMKWLFYIFYPLHLYLILFIRMYLINLGYLFFN